MIIACRINSCSRRIFKLQRHTLTLVKECQRAVAHARRGRERRNGGGGGCDDNLQQHFPKT